jgi:iron-sulfur cluster repair protein YtfE (RIC family)
VENVPTSHASEAPLRRALEQEHREIDGILERCVDGPVLSADDRAELRRAVEELRRHIYAEEELLFPALREAGIIGPILVMLREHGQMWPILDRLDLGLSEQIDSAVLRADCRALLALSQLHNPKEEQILYPELDRVVGADAGADVHELLETGRVPTDWTCHFLRAADGRR